MAVNKAFTAYKAASISNSKPEDLVMMLYTGLVRFIMQAQKAIEADDIEKAHENITRAQDIISELEASLNMEYEISHNMMLLYDFLYRRLVDANVKKDQAILGEVLKFAIEFRDTWAQAMKNAKDQAQTPHVVEK
ncbi:MAG: flagellar export chaperone FliS [Bacteroidota bacterium]